MAKTSKKKSTTSIEQKPSAVNTVEIIETPLVVTKPIEVENNGKMKYSKDNKPLTCMLTQSTCYKGTSNMLVRGIMWCSTNSNTPFLKRYIQPSSKDENVEELLKILGVNESQNDWNHIERQSGFNGWIGKLSNGTVSVVQTMPWNYKSWYCGRGLKGSCQEGWIQIMLCEDNLDNKNYFEQVYKEACEITAYLCKLYGINPNGVEIINGVKVPTILSHTDAHKLEFAIKSTGVNSWFAKYDKDMAAARKDIAELLADKVEEVVVPVVEEEKYRIRKSWEDAKSQIGKIFYDLDKAKIACDEAGKDYEIYNSKGIAIYPEGAQEEIEKEESNVEVDFKIGEAVSLLNGATYASGDKVPGWVFKSKLYVREIRKNGTVVISTQKTGATAGCVAAKYLVKYSSETPVVASPTFTPYLIRVNVDTLYARSGAGNGYRITAELAKSEAHTIVDEKNGWGKLKNGSGWIKLENTIKI